MVLKTTNAAGSLSPRGGMCVWPRRCPRRSLPPRGHRGQRGTRSASERARRAMAIDLDEVQQVIEAMLARPLANSTGKMRSSRMASCRAAIRWSSGWCPSRIPPSARLCLRYSSTSASWRAWRRQPGWRESRRYFRGIARSVIVASMVTRSTTPRNPSGRRWATDGTQLRPQRSTRSSIRRSARLRRRLWMIHLVDDYDARDVAPRRSATRARHGLHAVLSVDQHDCGLHRQQRGAGFVGEHVEAGVSTRLILTPCTRQRPRRSASSRRGLSSSS